TIAAQGTVVALNNQGQALVQSGTRLFLVQPDGTTQPRTYPGADTVSGYGLNNSGVVVGSASGLPLIWDETGTPNVLHLPITLSLVNSFVYSVKINDAGEIAGAYPLGSGPAGVFRLTADGFFRDVGTAVRAPLLGLSNAGTLFFTYEGP